jgi:hypothetical protein
MRTLACFASILESRVKGLKPTTLYQMAKPSVCTVQFSTWQGVWFLIADYPCIFKVTQYSMLPMF